jgi:RimJ/RimL family protein N-acetyltransferase
VITAKADELEQVWPLYGLVLQLDDWRLMLPRTVDLVPLLRARAIETSSSEDSTGVRWQQWALFQGFVKTISQWTPTDWHLSFCINHAGVPVGLQGLLRGGDPQIVTTDSWIEPTHRSLGHGTAARLIVLRFARDYLGAKTAVATSFEENTASNIVNRRVGYELVSTSEVPDSRDRELEWRLDLSSWECRKADALRITGFTHECRQLIGVAADV